MLYVRIKYSMYDLNCDVISCCVRACNMGTINEYDKIVTTNKKRRTHGNLHLKQNLGMEFTAG